MKVLIITDAWEPQINGVVTTLQNTIKEMISRGIEVETINPLMFKSLPFPGYEEIKLALVTPRSIGKMIEQFNPEYIHIATEGPIGLAARSYLRSKKQQWSSSFHTKYAEFIEARVGFGANVVWKWLKNVYKNDCFILVTTESMKKELADKGFDRDKIKVWSRGVDTEIFESKVSSPDDIVLLNVGRVSVEKNLEEFYNLKIPGRKIQVGNGPAMKKYMEKYPDVEFVGPKTGTELASYYQNASVMVFPSTKDTFGVVMIESMRCGTPVAAYPVTGPIDVITDNQNGFMSNDLETAVLNCLAIDRKTVVESSKYFTWASATDRFIDALVKRHIT